MIGGKKYVYIDGEYVRDEINFGDIIEEMENDIDKLLGSDEMVLYKNNGFVIVNKDIGNVCEKFKEEYSKKFNKSRHRDYIPCFMDLLKDEPTKDDGDFYDFFVKFKETYLEYI